MRARQRLVGRDLALPPGRLGQRGERFRIGRLVAPAARRIDAAQDELQQMDGAAGVEAVGVGRDAAHGVHRDRPADHALVTPAGRVGPRHVDGDALFEGGVGQLGGDALDRGGRDAGALGHRLGRVARVEIALGDEMERRHGLAAVGQRHLAGQRRARVHGGRIDRPAQLPVPGKRPALGVAREQAVLGAARIAHHEPGRVGVAGEIVGVDLAGLDQLVDEREHEEAVGAGRDAEPFVGDRRIAGAHRIDRDELGAARLELARARS